MKKLFQFTMILAVLAAFGVSVEAQKGNGRYWEGKQNRKEYRRDVKSARKEYRRDVREARRDYRQDRRYNSNQRGRGYYTVRPYRGAVRGNYRGRLPQRVYSTRSTRRGYVVRRYR